MLKKIKRSLMFLSTGCIFLNVAILLGGVFSRYLFNSSPMWVDELARYLLIGAVMMMAGVLVMINDHMRLNIIDKISNRKVLFIVTLYRHAVTTGVAVFMSYASFLYAVSIANFTTIGLGISKSIPLYVLPFGFACISMYSLVNLVDSIKEGGQ